VCIPCARTSWHDVAQGQPPLLRRIVGQHLRLRSTTGSKCTGDDCKCSASQHTFSPSSVLLAISTQIPSDRMPAESMTPPFAGPASQEIGQHTQPTARTWARVGSGRSRKAYLWPSGSCRSRTSSPSSSTPAVTSPVPCVVHTRSAYATQSRATWHCSRRGGLGSAGEAQAGFDVSADQLIS